MANVTDRIIAVGDIARKPLLVISEARTAPTVGILDAPLRCIVLNEEWFKHVGGAIEVLTEWRAWNDDMDERSDSVQEILKILSGEYCMFQLRQNPNNPCLMEQSLDNGVTWTTAMDYSQCVSPALASQALNDSIDALTALLLAYDTTVTSIAPDMVYDATATDDIRDLALCHALSEVVDLMCELELEYRRQIALASNITAVMLALLGVAVTIMTGGTATPLYLAVSATLAGGFGTIFGGLSTLILNDETAKDAVVCCMRDALAGATITKLGFEQSLDACGFTGGTNEAQLSGAISELLTQDDVYESFVDYMQRAYRFAELGIADCPCGEFGCTIYDFSIDEQTFVAANLGGPWEPRSVYHTAEGWGANPAQLRGQNLIEKFFVGTISKITIDLDINMTDGGYPGSGLFWYRVDNQTSVSAYHVGVDTHTFTFPEEIVNTRVACGIIWHSDSDPLQPLAPQKIISVKYCD